MLSSRDLTRCRFGDDLPVVGVYELERGCVCYPDDRRQALCAQHAFNAEPLGWMRLVEGEGI